MEKGSGMGERLLHARFPGRHGCCCFCRKRRSHCIWHCRLDKRAAHPASYNHPAYPANGILYFPLMEARGKRNLEPPLVHPLKPAGRCISLAALVLESAGLQLLINYKLLESQRQAAEPTVEFLKF